eukprot:scaffold14825_cov123-Isochrysis_galbana.AAC.2
MHPAMRDASECEVRGWRWRSSDSRLPDGDGRRASVRLTYLGLALIYAGGAVIVIYLNLSRSTGVRTPGRTPRSDGAILGRRTPPLRGVRPRPRAAGE